MNTRDIINQRKESCTVANRIITSKQIRLVGNSMEPLLDASEILTLFVVDCCDYRVGDIVVFKNENSIVGISVHRIIRISGNTITTKGDNNIRSDKKIVANTVIGKIEKALTKSLKIIRVKSSRFIAIASRIESNMSKILPRRLAVINHRLIVKAYSVLFCGRKQII